jgi:hypothetical protein
MVSQHAIFPDCFNDICDTSSSFYSSSDLSGDSFFSILLRDDPFDTPPRGRPFATYGGLFRRVAVLTLGLCRTHVPSDTFTRVLYSFFRKRKRVHVRTVQCTAILPYYYYTIFLVGEGTCASQGLKDPESPGGSDLRDASRKVWQLGVTEE